MDDRPPLRDRIAGKAVYIIAPLGLAAWLTLLWLMVGDLL